MLKEVDESIMAAVAAGRIDPKAHAAPIEALRELARKAEAADPDSRDNVTFPTMLKYMDALRLLPDPPAAEPEPAAKKAGNLVKFQGKYGKRAV